MNSPAQRINEAGLEIIRDAEGLRLKRYRCPAGVWTIGYGHTNGVTAASPAITEETAERLLIQDVAVAEAAVRKLVRISLNQNQFSALTSFIYNIGEGNFRNSTSLAILNRGDYRGFANRLPLWNKANGVVLPGLVARRAREKALFLKPETEA